MTEFCFNDNAAGGVYPKFDVTFTATAGAAAAAPLNVQHFTVNAAAANPMKVTCLCSKCRCAA